MISKYFTKSQYFYILRYNAINFKLTHYPLFHKIRMPFFFDEVKDDMPDFRKL